MEPKKKTFKNKNIFEYLKNILSLKDRALYETHISEEGFETDFKKVVLMRYLSMSEDSRIRNLVFENQLSFDRMDCKMLYRYLMAVVPKQKNHFIRYIK